MRPCRDPFAPPCGPPPGTGYRSPHQPAVPGSPRARERSTRPPGSCAGTARRPRRAALLASRDGRRGTRRSALDLRDLELALRAARDGNRHHVVALVSEQRLADRRLVRQLHLARVGLGRADDLVLDGLLRLLILDVHDRTDRDDVGRDRTLVDQGCRTQLVLELGDLLLEHGLLVLRVVVLGVLRDVAEAARLLDP